MYLLPSQLGWQLLGGAYGEDSGLWWVNDGREAVDRWVHAHVANGKGSALIFFWFQFAISRALSEVLDLCRDRFEAESFD